MSGLLTALYFFLSRKLQRDLEYKTSECLWGTVADVHLRVNSATLNYSSPVRHPSWISSFNRKVFGVANATTFLVYPGP